MSDRNAVRVVVLEGGLMWAVFSLARDAHSAVELGLGSLFPLSTYNPQSA
jgi:hypothetical protein